MISVIVSRFNASSFHRPKKESVMRLIHCKEEAAFWLMVQFALYGVLSSPLLSSLGLKTGGVFPFCQSKVCLLGLSLYQCKQKRGSGCWCFFSPSKILLLVSVFDPGRRDSNCYHLWGKLTSAANSLAMQIQKKREESIVRIEVYEDAVSFVCVEDLIFQFGCFWLILEGHERSLFIFIHRFLERSNPKDLFVLFCCLFYFLAYFKVDTILQSLAFTIKNPYSQTQGRS